MSAKIQIRVLIAGIAVLFLSKATAIAIPPAATDQWSWRISTRFADTARGVSTDGLGNVYVAGDVFNSPFTRHDGFVVKLNSSGVTQWYRVIDSGVYDEAIHVSADVLGNVFVVGRTEGSLSIPNPVSNDSFLMNYSPLGHQKWAVQLGLNESGEVRRTAADGIGTVYLVGKDPSGPFLKRYDSDGVLLWSQSIGGEEDQFDLAVDRLGGVFVGGEACPALGCAGLTSRDGFVSKFNTEGHLQWRHQFDFPLRNTVFGVAPDGLGNVYVSGATSFNPDRPTAHDLEGFLAKFDAVGNLLWFRNFGTPEEDRLADVYADRFGNIYTTGYSDATVLPLPTEGSSPNLVIKYDPNGNLLWIRRVGQPFDNLGGLAVDEMGGIYISGLSAGADPILYKLYDPGFLVPEPGCISLAVAAFFAVAVGPGRFRRYRRPALF
jgi:hypothetical protein